MFRQARKLNKNNINNIIKRDFFRIVSQGTEAYRLFLGKNPKKLEPGIHISVPLIHRVLKVDMREGSYNISKLNAYTKDNVSVLISGSLFYQVLNSYDACFKVQDYGGNITNLGTSAMRSVVGLFQYDEIIADRHKINTQLSEMIGKSSMPWGIVCTKFEIQSFVPANKEVEHQLEKQLEAERNRRKQVLDTEANVNVAEGEKRRMILQSEGMLIAAKNEAEATLLKTQKEAEGKKFLMDQETVAMEKQINTIKNSLGSSELAVKYLVEQQKFKHLSAMANGPNNNTYFVPEGNNLISNIKLFGDSVNHKD
ncbi:stomatin family protein [Catovirus CTV1]|uniref:Stomatin family protein n=1 Tax=Catovirus CTV1 TaxID=1977631 RepID=A0A1V0SB59_9VIRU|nr:stomatin family protein [Catovirus CTV1]